MRKKKNKQICGIYKITNTINNKYYIGQSKEIEKRWKRHKKDLDNDKHTNLHIKRAWDKYGQDNFTFEIIEECPENKLNEREIYWIAFYNSNNYNYGYNQDSGGQEGKILNKDVRQRIGEAREYPTGENCANAKLTNEQVLKIKKLLFKEELSCMEIADEYNVSEHIVYNIRSLKTYKNVTSPYDEAIRLQFENSNSRQKLDEEAVYEIKKLLYEENYSDVEISKMYGVTDSTISLIRRGKNWSKVKTEFDNSINRIKVEKLSTDEVEEIKYIIANNDSVTNKELAERFNVDSSAISNIRTLKSYFDVAIECNNAIYENNKHKKKPNILTKNEVVEIKKMLANQIISNRELAEKYNVDFSVISNIKLLKSHNGVATEYNNILSEKYKMKDKLTNIQVLEIKRLLFEDEYTCSEIADIFNVENYAIYRIRSLDSYKEVVSPYDNELKLKSQNNKRKLNEEMVKEIKKLIYEEKLSDSEVAKMYNTKRETINSIRLGKIWSHVKTEHDDIISEKKFENLSLDNVVQIKKLIATTEITNKELAQKYKVDASSISNIKTLKSYIEIASEYNDTLFEKNKTKKNPNKLTSEQVSEIKKRLAMEEVPNKELADIYKVDRSAISNIKLLKVYKDVAPEYNDILREKYSKLPLPKKAS